jgi:hypothetical protein
MRYLLSLIVTMMLCINVQAQFTDSTNYYVKFNSTGLVNKTNDRDSYLFNNALRFSFYKKNISVNTLNTWVYGKQNHDLSNNDFLSVLDFDLFKKKNHVYFWGLVNYERSYSLKIDNRFQGGGGLGYYLLDKDDFIIQVSDGLLYEKSDLVPQEGLDSDYETMRNSFRLKFRFTFHNRFTLEGVDFLQHSLSDKKDYNIKSTTNLSVKIWKLVNFTIVVNYNKLNLTSRENFLMTFGLSFEKYF